MNGCFEEDEQEAIMASLEPGLGEIEQKVAKAKTMPDVLTSEMQSLNLLADHENNRLSFLLLNDRDGVTVTDLEELCLKLGCDQSTNAKVVSILGNAGDGKSYALNKLFFDLDGDEEVFATSSSAGDSCTIGVWAAFEPRMQVLVLDTEGMHGLPAMQPEPQHNDIRRMRQLLKILAISDIVIYKTRLAAAALLLLYC